MFDQSLITLEFSDLLLLVARETRSECGRALALQLAPSTNLGKITEQLTQTSEARRFISEVGNLSVGDLADLSKILDKLKISGTLLEVDQLQKIVRSMETGEYLRKKFYPVRLLFPALGKIFLQLPDLHKLCDNISRILLPTGEINESASPELRSIRKEIQRQRLRIQNQLDSLLKRKDLETVFSDQIITQRNGRFVLPVRSDSRGHFPGVVHALSSSGVTTFVEPLASIELNNEMIRLQEKEEAEITRILFQLTESLRIEQECIEILALKLSEIDFTFAKAHFANKFKATEPRLNKDGRFYLKNARHPLLEEGLRSEGKAVVPISFLLDDSDRVMVISGPNAGGKTVVLKTAGLCVLMAQAGLHVPSQEADICLFNQVQTDIGDHQSLSANLSTFSSHISNLNRITQELFPPALVLIDEIGTGTDPDEGAALGIALVEFFREQNAYVIVSTHYGPLKIYADTTPGVINAAVEFNNETLQPTYKLIQGQAGVSSGIEIARKLGVSQSILQVAEEKLGTKRSELSKYLEKLKEELDYQQNSNVALEEEREVLAKRYANLNLEFTERENARQKIFSEVINELREDFLTQTDSILKHITDQTERIKLQKETERSIKKLTEISKQKLPPVLIDKSIEEIIVSKKIKDQLIEASIEIDIDAELQIGDTVRTQFGQEGIIEKIDHDSLLVRIGVMKLKTTMNQVKKTKNKDQSTKDIQRTSPTIFPKFRTEDISTEINVIGCTVDEAVERVDKFLDDAFLNSLTRLRIIHGMGSGILRRSLGEMLKEHPHVENSFLAPSNEGGSGATIVELLK